MTNPVTSYASLTSALQDFAHRADIGNALASDSVVPTDYFIQSAIEAIQSDIPDLNFGNYIQPMEAAYAPSVIQGGTLPVPADWLGPKVLYISDGNSDQWPLLFKSAAWLNSVYSVRQPTGLPAYVARDVMAAAAFTATLSTGGVLAVTALASGILQTGMILSDGAVHLPANTPGNAVIVTGQTSGVQGSTGNYTAASISPLAPTPSATSESMTGGGNILTFGPYPDSDYQVSGTYYQAIPALSSSNTTNWVTTVAPMMLHSACMIEVGKFLLDDGLIARWSPIYQQRLKALVDRDKAERWSMATMAIETDTSW